MLNINKVEKDKEQAKILIRYLLFYGCIITVLSLITYLMDLLFYYHYIGPIKNYRYPPKQYFLFYVIGGFMILPLSLMYNYLINKLPSGLKFKKVLFSILFMFIIGFLIKSNYRFGYYIGEYRVLKNLISMILSGIIIEIIRFYVVRYRYRVKS